MKYADKMQNFAIRLIAARRRCALTQQELAARAQVSLRSIQVWENGTMNLPRPNLLRRLCAVLGVSPESLLEDDKPVNETGVSQPLKVIPTWLETLHDRLGGMEPERRDALIHAILAFLN